MINVINAKYVNRVLYSYLKIDDGQRQQTIKSKRNKQLGNRIPLK